MNQEQKSLSKSAKRKPVTISKRKKEQPKKASEKPAFIWGSWSNIKVNSEYLSRLAQELAEWVVMDDEAFKIQGFLRRKGLTWEIFQDWKAMSDDLKRAHSFALMVIGDRRETGSIMKRIDGHWAGRMMSHYDPDWKKMQEWEASLKNTTTTAIAFDPANIPNFPSSDLVPERRDLANDE